MNAPEPHLPRAATRRQFLLSAAALSAAPALICAATPAQREAAPTNPVTTTPSASQPTMKIGFHTDAFNSAYWSFDKCLQWAQKNDVHHIECGLIDGVSWIHGLGYQPHVALYEDPALLRQTMAQYGVQFSQIDAAYPLSGVDGPVRGLPYVLKSIPWAKHAGSARVATTDGLHKPAGLSDDQAMDRMKETYAAILETAEAYDVTITIEVHGYFTTNPDRM